jgi:hypothetical protein
MKAWGIRGRAKMPVFSADNVDGLEFLTMTCCRSTLPAAGRQTGFLTNPYT